MLYCALSLVCEVAWHRLNIDLSPWRNFFFKNNTQNNNSNNMPLLIKYLRARTGVMCRLSHTRRPHHQVARRPKHTPPHAIEFRDVCVCVPFIMYQLLF